MCILAYRVALFCGVHNSVVLAKSVLINIPNRNLYNYQSPNVHELLWRRISQIIFMNQRYLILKIMNMLHDLLLPNSLSVRHMR